VDLQGLARQRDDGDDPAAKGANRAIESVVTDDHDRPSFVGLGSTLRFEVGIPDLASPHALSPSPEVLSHAAASGDASHSSMASR
jgi:hypothetical protein